MKNEKQYKKLITIGKLTAMIKGFKNKIGKVEKDICILTARC
jgi:hypothetical protein